MNKKLTILILLLLTTFVFAENPPGAINFKNIDMKFVLSAYKDLSGLQLVIASNVRMQATVTVKSLTSISKADALQLIEKAVADQTGVIISKLDDKRASVTWNDHLPTKPAE